MVLPLKWTGVDSSPSNAGNPAISGTPFSFSWGDYPSVVKSHGISPQWEIFYWWVMENIYYWGDYPSYITRMNEIWKTRLETYCKSLSELGKPSWLSTGGFWLWTLSHGHVLAQGFKTTTLCGCHFSPFSRETWACWPDTGLILALLIPPIAGLAGHQCPFQHLRPGAIATEGYSVRWIQRVKIIDSSLNRICVANKKWEIK